LTSLKDAWSMRIVNGLNCPVRDATGRTPLAFLSAGTWGGSSCPAAWMDPVTRAS